MKRKLSKPEPSPLCKCGCGKCVTRNTRFPYDWNKYVYHHHRRGIKQSAEHIKKRSEANRGQKRSKEQLKRMRRVTTQRFRNPENRKKASESAIKRYKNPEQRRNFSGSDNPNWCGGATLERKPQELTEKLRQAIRRRDNFECQFCGRRWKKGERKFDVHHIDGDRHNNHPDNLLTVCRSCHRDIQPSGDKEVWQRVYTNLVKKSKRLNPQAHRDAVRIWKENMKVFYPKD